MPLSQELNIAIELARKAGKAIMEFYDSDIIVEQKLSKIVSPNLLRSPIKLPVRLLLKV